MHSAFSVNILSDMPPCGMRAGYIALSVGTTRKKKHSRAFHTPATCSVAVTLSNRAAELRDMFAFFFFLFGIIFFFFPASGVKGGSGGKNNKQSAAKWNKFQGRITRGWSLRIMNITIFYSDV
jgi:hypothetical protein